SAEGGDPLDLAADLLELGTSQLDVRLDEPAGSVDGRPDLLAQAGRVGLGRRGGRRRAAGWLIVQGGAPGQVGRGLDAPDGRVRDGPMIPAGARPLTAIGLRPAAAGQQPWGASPAAGGGPRRATSSGEAAGGPEALGRVEESVRSPERRI